jgi:hypothetical protein
MIKRNVCVAAAMAAAMVMSGAVLAQGQEEAKAAPVASEPAKAAEAPKQARPAVTVTVGGQKTSIAESPVWFEWTGSEALTKLGSQAALDRGLQAAASSSAAAVRVTVSGELALIGGPKFYRGVRAPLADVVDKAAKLDGKRSADASDARRIAVDSAVATGVISAGLGAVASGLALADVFVSIADATGFRGWFNSKVAGDPRGLCFGSHCETWNQVKQTAYVRVVVQRGDQASQEVRIMSQANSEVLVIDDVVDQALAAVWALFPQRAPENPPVAMK